MKIIKKDSLEASQVQAYSFQLPVPPADEPAPDLAEDLLVDEEVSEVQETEEPAPRVDLELLERTAHQKGFQEGEQAGREAATRELEAPMRRLAESIRECQGLKATLYAQVEREVVQLAMRVAGKIIHREVQSDPHVIRTLVKLALDHVAEQNSATVHVHPQDYEYLLQHEPSLSAMEGDMILQPDAAIERGGCLVRTDCGDIDARIGSQLEEIQQGFLKDLD